MKVLHLIDSGGLYGAEKVLLALVKEQQRQGLEPMILSAGSPDIEEKALEAEARKQGLPVTPWRMRPGLNMGETRKILEWAKKEGFDVLHSHGYKFNILLAMQPRRAHQFSIVTTLHGYVHAKRFSKMWFYELLDRLAISRMHSVVMVADAMKNDRYISERVHNNSEVIPNGIDTHDLEMRSLESLDADIEQFCNSHDPVIMGVGRFAYEKGFDVLIDAFSNIKEAYPDAGLLIAGEGTLRSSLEAQVLTKGVGGSVLLPGYCDNIAACLKQVDVLAIPSRTEGLPIILLEAMALQVSIVASDVGAIPRTLGFGQGGIVLPSPRPELLADAIVSVLTSTEECQRRVSWARKHVDSSYSTAIMTKRYSEVYARAVRA